MGTSWQEEEEEEEEDAPQQEPPKDKLMLRSPGLVYGTRSWDDFWWFKLPTPLI